MAALAEATGLRVADFAANTGRDRALRDRPLLDMQFEEVRDRIA